MTRQPFPRPGFTKGEQYFLKHTGYAAIIVLAESIIYALVGIRDPTFLQAGPSAIIPVFYLLWRGIQWRNAHPEPTLLEREAAYWGATVWKEEDGSAPK